jgi:hypothetical protein
MALIAEEVVEEWLNQQGYFTIRGIKLGVHEMDILAVKLDGEKADLRHYEVQASINPVSYISSVPKAIQKSTGRAASSSKTRTQEEILVGVREWIEKKFLHPRKGKLRQQLFAGEWSFYFVVNVVKHSDEIEEFERSQVTILRLRDILNSLKDSSQRTYSASGKDLVDLMLMDTARYGASTSSQA